jgi:hypothetical protein
MKTIALLVNLSVRWCTAMGVQERFIFVAWIHPWNHRIYPRERIGGFVLLVLFRMSVVFDPLLYPLVTFLTFTFLFPSFFVSEPTPKTAS